MRALRLISPVEISNVLSINHHKRFIVAESQSAGRCMIATSFSPAPIPGDRHGRRALFLSATRPNCLWLQ
jgi:hypothetical protein